MKGERVTKRESDELFTKKQIEPLLQSCPIFCSLLIIFNYSKLLFYYS